MPAGPPRAFPARLRRSVEAPLLLAPRRGRAGAGDWVRRGAGRGAGRPTRIGAGRAWPFGCDWRGEVSEGRSGVPRPRQAALLEHFSWWGRSLWAREGTGSCWRRRRVLTRADPSAPRCSNASSRSAESPSSHSGGMLASWWPSWMLSTRTGSAQSTVPLSFVF